MSLPLQGAYILDNASGHALSAQHTRIAEIIRDYNEELELAWIPPNERTSFDAKPFAIIHNMPNGSRYVVGTFSEAEMDHRIIAHLFNHDARNRDVLSDLDRENAAKELVSLKERQDELEDQQAMARAMIKTKQSTWKHGGKKFNLL
jgi:hypothetical protein